MTFQVFVLVARFVLHEEIVVWGMEKEYYPDILQGCPTIQRWPEGSRNTTNVAKSRVSIQNWNCLSSQCEISCKKFLVSDIRCLQIQRFCETEFTHGLPSL